MGDETQQPDSVEGLDHGPFQPGEVIAGKYRVDRLVGLGGMGQVVAATHVDLGQEVAIKILLRSRAKDAEAVERFLREAHAAVRLKSTHVARVFDVGTTNDGLPYIVMELLDGRDLCDVLTDHGRVSVGDAVDFILQACDAVAEAHARGIIHRDIKPENLFLTSRRDGTPCIKVLDFGISKVGGGPVGPGGPRRGRRSLTQDNVVMGSPAYMSPEQVKSSKNADQRSDIWSLGVTLYELLTGSEPFTGESTPDIFVSILTTEPPPPSQLVADVPIDLSNLVMRCLTKDPALRFQDVESLAQALLPFATRKPTSVAPSWTQTSPEFRVPGIPPAAGVPGSTPRLLASSSTVRLGDPNGPPSSRVMTPPSASPAALSSTIIQPAVPPRKAGSTLPYMLGGVVAALVVGSLAVGVGYQRRHANAAEPPTTAEPTPVAVPVPVDSASASPTTAPPPTVAVAADPPASSASPKPAASSPKTKVTAPPTATKPAASALPRHRTTW